MISAHANQIIGSGVNFHSLYWTSYHQYHTKETLHRKQREKNVPQQCG